MFFAEPLAVPVVRHIEATEHKTGTGGGRRNERREGDEEKKPILSRINSSTIGEPDSLTFVPQVAIILLVLALLLVLFVLAWCFRTKIRFVPLRRHEAFISPLLTMKMTMVQGVLGAIH